MYGCIGLDVRHVLGRWISPQPNDRINLPPYMLSPYDMLVV